MSKPTKRDYMKYYVVEEEEEDKLDKWCDFLDRWNINPNGEECPDCGSTHTEADINAGVGELPTAKIACNGCGLFESYP